MKQKQSLVYEKFFRSDRFFFGEKPAPVLYRLLEMIPSCRGLEALEIGSGEGRNAIFLARNGLKVTAVDISRTGIKKTLEWAARLGLSIEAHVEDMAEFMPRMKYDIILSTWSLQFMPPEKKAEAVQSYKDHTRPGGYNVFSLFVQKPYLKIPHHERHCHLWRSGEIMNLYWNWQVEFQNEEVFDCQCGGRPHRHAANSLIAKRISAAREPRVC